MAPVVVGNGLQASRRELRLGIVRRRFHGALAYRTSSSLGPSANALLALPRVVGLFGLSHSPLESFAALRVVEAFRISGPHHGVMLRALSLVENDEAAALLSTLGGAFILVFGGQLPKRGYTRVHRSHARVQSVVRGACVVISIHHTRHTHPG